VEEARRADNAPELARAALFLLGLSAQHLDQGARGRRAYAGHRLSLHGAMDGPQRPRPTPIWAAKGANWIGEAPFSTRKHVFQNLGDGTYNHSGIQAIRAAVAAGTNITYKILFNDAVAMTGGQGNEGDLTPPHRARGQGHGRREHRAGLRPEGRDRLICAFPQGPRTPRARSS
jgi:indolepyruvate ferredoxin oxidoreductase